MATSGLNAVATEPSPARISLAELISLKAAGETLNLSTLRVRALGVGAHLSPFKGRGVEYDESRLYQPGDDLRTMDWRLTARTDKPHTKVFRDERDRPVIVWLDLRRPMHFATHGVFKAVRAAQMAALISWSAVSNGDRVGGLIFSEHEHFEIRPRMGRRSSLRLFQAMSRDSFWAPSNEDGSNKSDAEHALARLTRVARPGSMIFLISDFRNLGEHFERNFRLLAAHCDVFAIHMYDSVEVDLPPPGHYRIHADSKTVSIDTDSDAARRRYRQLFQERRAMLEKLTRYPSVHSLDCSTTDDPRAVLMERFEHR
ncbi:MAG: DUF58 domain-containing protein [Candidatus Rariloculaceae bacterium]